jgi:transitional endoplasmic reticulum ATPase
LEDVNTDRLAELTEGYTGADITSLSSAAVVHALREHLSMHQAAEEANKHAKELKVHMKHFEEAMKKIRP